MNKLTLAQFFKEFGLTINFVASYADINPSLLRSYVCGSKIPSPKQIAKINQAIVSITANLMKTFVVEDTGK